MKAKTARNPSVNRAAVRRAIADYMRSEGCQCCQNTEAHDEAYRRLGKLLGVPKYDDGSGYDFGRYATKRP